MDNLEAVEAEPKGLEKGRWLRRANLPEFAERVGLAAMFAILIVVFSVLRPDTFPTAANWRAIATTNAVIAVLALAMLAPLVTGRFDVSAGANMTMCAILCGVLMQHGWALVFAILAAIVVGGLIGVGNGVMVAYLGVNSIIGTLGTATIIGAIVIAYTKGIPVTQDLSPTLTNLSIERVAGIPVLFVIMLIISVVVWFLLTQTPFGRYLNAVGTNIDAARLTGLPVARLVMSSFALGGLIAGIAGIMLIGTLGAASPDTAEISSIVPALAAAFLGATTWQPGRYNVPGTLLALFFLAALASGLAMIGARPWVTDALNGAIVIFAVAIGVQIKRRHTGSVEVGD